MIKSRNNLNNETLLARFKNLLFDLDTNKKAAIYYYFIFVVRRVAMIILIFALIDNLVL
jgi:hypothetical protein